MIEVSSPMEYEFKRDLYDRPEARVELEQALFGRWLGEELGENRAQGEQILARAEQLVRAGQGHWAWHGRELSLELEHDSARVWLQSGGLPDALEPGFGLADEAAEAGLEDFIDLLRGWLDYIAG